MFRYFKFVNLMSAALLALSASVAVAQPAKKEFEPYSGQSGKDVVWVPTPQALVDRMLDMARLSPADIHYDLGSGDGRTVITAAKRGVKANGIEYNPEMVELARRNAQKEGVSDKAIFTQGDIFMPQSVEAYSKANVITLFLLPDLNVKLRPNLLNMKPGTRIVSNSFSMGEWKEDDKITAGGDCTSWCTAYLWIIPAKVAGNWKMPRGTLSLKQEFQVISGTLNTGSVSAIISDAKMNGEQITFSAGGAKYIGRVNGNNIEGSYTSSTESAKWSAAK